MGTKIVVRQKLCSLNWYAISYAVAWNLKIMKYSASAMITHSPYFEITVALLFAVRARKVLIDYEILQ